MKYAILILTIFLFSCNKKEGKKNEVSTIESIQNKKTKKIDSSDYRILNRNFLNDSLIFYKTERQYKFDLKSIEKDVNFMSNNDLDKYTLNKELSKDINRAYYKLISFCEPKEIDFKDFKSIVVFGNYDYYNDLILLNYKDNQLISEFLLSSIQGDGDEQVEKKSTIKNNIIKRISSFKKLDTRSNSYKLIKEITETFKVLESGEILKIN